MNPSTPSINSPAFSHGHAGMNLAPAEPLLQLRQGNSSHESSLQRALKDLFDAKMRYEKSTWDELISMGQLVSLFRQGKQLLMKKPYGPGYYVREVAGNDSYKQTAMNVMNFYAQRCKAQFMSSNPNIVVRAASDDPRAIQSASAARPVVDHYESKFYTPRFCEREALHALDDGIYLHRVYYDPFLPGPKAQKKQVSQIDFQLGQGYGECYECGFQRDDASVFQNPQLAYGSQCPECGGHAVDVVKPQSSPVSSVSQGEQVQYGDLDIRQLAFPACRWDLSRDAEDSSWFIYRQRIPPGLIKLFLGDAIIPDTQSSDDRSLDILHAMAYSGQAMQGASSQGAHKRDTDKKPTLCEFWISPEDYAGIRLEGGKTISGQEIPKGRMSDMFKRPVCAVGLNDMSLVIGLFEERHRDQIVSGQWFVESESGAGRGMHDVVAVQKRFNAGDGQLYQGMAGTATPAVAHDSRLLKEDQAGYLFKPGTNLDINLTMLPPGMKLQDAFYMPQPGQVSQQYISYVENFLKDMFQLSSLVTGFTTGLQGVSPNTATGAQITNLLADSLFAPMLMGKAGVRRRIAEIICDQHRRHVPVPRFFSNSNGKGKYLSGADLQGDLVFEVEQDSELPVTPFTRQRDFAGMVQGVGGADGLVALKQADPDIFRHVLSVYNVRIEAEDSDTVSNLCQTRLDQFERNFSIGVVDPQILVSSLKPPVSMREPKHTEKRLWWSEFLDREDGQEAPPPVRQAAEMMYDLHQQYETGKMAGQAVGQGIIQTAQNVPGQLAQAAAPQAMQEMGIGQDPNEQAMQQSQGEEASRAHESAENQADRDAETERHREELASRERIAQMGRKEAA